MKPTRKISRRSFLGRVAGGALVGGAALTVLGESAQAVQSDNDPTDASGRGYTGVTDNDSGSNADRAGHGRSRRSGLTDNDTGSNADAAGNGRGRRTSGVTDNDTGSNADPAGNGRGRRTTGLTDNDSGNW